MEWWITRIVDERERACDENVLHLEGTRRHTLSPKIPHSVGVVKFIAHVLTVNHAFAGGHHMMDVGMKELAQITREQRRTGEL